MKCIVCKHEIEGSESYHNFSGLQVCENCCETYTIVYTLINGTTNACFVKRKDI